VPTFYDLDVQEQMIIWEMLRQLCRRVSESMKVEGFDAGFVDPVDGTEPAHTHVHLIPRVAGQRFERPPGAEWVDLGA
jgi:diadenosine tetraphosphate (Ap4A) HIT family hydrolase